MYSLLDTVSVLLRCSDAKLAIESGRVIRSVLRNSGNSVKPHKT